LIFTFPYLGWFLLLTSIIGYVRVKRFEMSIRAAQRIPSSSGGSSSASAGGADGQPISESELERVVAIRRNLEDVFGIPLRSAGTDVAAMGHQEGDENTAASRHGHEPRTEREARLMAEEARLERDLRAAGLI
jgi:hypothetical protein